MRGRGEGTLFYDAKRGIWTGRVELPPDAEGNRRRKTIRRKDKTELIRELNKLRNRLEVAGNIPTVGMTVDAWADYWLREIAMRTRRPTTILSYQSILKRQIIPSMGKIRLDKVTPVTVRKTLAAMEKAGRSSTYMRNAHGIMSAMFKDAEREGRIPRSPVDLVTAPRKAVPQLETLTVAQTRRLIEAFAESPDGYLWATFLLTGARRGEILGLTWDRVGETIDLSWQLQRIPAGHRPPADFERRQVSGGLYWTRPKSRAGWREIPLVDPLRGILAQWRTIAPDNEWGLVFTRRDSAGRALAIDPQFITKAWAKFASDNGFGNVRLHDIRHTTVDLLYAAGISEPDIMAIVGHSTVMMSRAYKSPATRERLAVAMEQLTRSLELGIVTQAPIDENSLTNVAESG